MNDISNTGGMEPDRDPVADLTVRQRVQAEMDGAGLSQTAVAREWGISGGALSQWLRGEYSGSNDNMARRAEQWLSLREKRSRATSALPTAPEWFEGPSAKAMRGVMAMAHLLGDFVCVYGGPGVGKTKTAERYRDDNTNVWLATISKATATPVPAMQEIGEAIGLRDINYTGARPLYRAIVRAITKTGGLLIVDEAQHLNDGSLEVIRAIHDETGIGVALVGNEAVYSRLTGGNRAMHRAQLFSRIGGRKYVAQPARGDVDAQAQAWGVSDPEIVQYLRSISAKPGALRGVTKTLRLAVMQAGSIDAMTLEHVQRAWSNLGADR